MIANEAGIGKGTVYQYFQSKEEIFGHIIIVVFDELLRSWQQIVESKIGPRRKIELMIDYTVDITIEMIHSNQKEQFSMIMEIFLYAFRNEGKVQLAEITQNIYKILDPVIEEGIEKQVFEPVEARYIGFILFSFLDGFGLHLFFQHKNYAPEKLKSIIKNLILKGILK